MSKFNRDALAARTGKSTVQTEAVASGVTHEGGPGFKHDSKSELFLLAVGSFFGEDSFYEKASDRDERFKSLIRACTAQDAEWTAKFLRWLRREGNIRTASLVGAVEFYRARSGSQDNPQNHDQLGRRVINDVLVRADEPGEMLAYLTSTYGKKISGGLKRGIADSVKRLYTEYNLLKWDSNNASFRFGDVVDLVRPAPVDAYQSALFKEIIDQRHNRTGHLVHADLKMIRARNELMTVPVENRRHILRHEPIKLREAGMTWESLSGWLQGPMDAEAWDAIIPQMGYMALLRNLRNFDEAGISRDAKNYVASILRDPAQVAKSRQLPFRFIAAHENAPSAFWTEPLNEALTYSLNNIPTLQGRSAVFIDTSSSMTTARFSKKSTMTAAKAAAVFGVALAKKNPDTDIFYFGDSTKEFTPIKGRELIGDIQALLNKQGDAGHGTDFQQAIAYGYRNHDRVFMISDMQTIGDRGWSRAYSHYNSRRWDQMVPAHVPIYGYNLGGGYKHGAMPTGENRHEFGGLTDATFRQVPLLENGKDGKWPWED